MPLLDGMVKAAQRRPCRVRDLALELEDDQDREIYWSAITDHTWSVGDLSRQLAQRGLRINKDTIARHRQGNCSCLKD